MFKCSNCSNISPKWSGKCVVCGQWNTYEEIEEIGKNPKKKISGKAQEIFGFVDTKNEVQKIKLKSEELNNVLGYGLTPGSLILLSGEPGIGKSTLALQMADWYGKEGETALYISGEENIYQISERAKRLKIKNEHIRIFNSNDFEDILETLEKDNSNLIIIDSISVIYSNSLGASSGSITQVRYITEMFMEFTKRTKKSIILIGHVTKDGSISGPKTLEHLVDTVLFLEGSKYENYRILRTFKNRFGPTDEVGLFVMTEIGLQDIKNPGLEFINEDNQKISGSAMAMTMEGNRPILIEIEALTTYTKFGYPKRSARGIQGGKLDLLIAVITKFTDIKLDSYDVYLNVTRGLSIQEPGVDLATIAAIISSKKGKPLEKTVFIGEISLTGIIKNVFNIQKRVEEAVKLGFENIVIPAGSKITMTKLNDIKLKEIKNVGELNNLI
ncbi:MAG: DNA repair protein RadA [Candidatus Gracilibacteria bacterium]|nr:DNA repair protein RadA [Candidatus Gracilibacteria bacterium]